MERTLGSRTIMPKRIAASWPSRLVAGVVGGALVYYGSRRERSLVGLLASTAGYSLIAKSIGGFIHAHGFHSNC
jgi:uncharacterized membrane protein